MRLSDLWFPAFYCAIILFHMGSCLRRMTLKQWIKDNEFMAVMLVAVILTFILTLIRVGIHA